MSEYELLVESIRFLTSDRYTNCLLDFSSNEDELLELLRIQYRALLEDGRRNNA